MESDLELSEAEKSSLRFSQEDVNRICEEYKRVMEDISREKMARDDGDAKRKDYNAEEMNMIEKMVRRRRERLMRKLRRRQTRKKKSKSEESFTSDSDEEMKTAQEEVKRLMEKAIGANMTWTLTDAKKYDSKAEEKNIASENMFPRRRGRLLRFLRRQRSKSPESTFHIEFHHLQLPSDDDSDDEELTKLGSTLPRAVIDEMAASRSREKIFDHQPVNR